MINEYDKGGDRMNMLKVVINKNDKDIPDLDVILVDVTCVKIILIRLKVNKSTGYDEISTKIGQIYSKS